MLAYIWMDAHEDSAKYATQKYHVVCTRKHDTNVYIHVFMIQMCANTLSQRKEARRFGRCI